MTEQENIHGIGEWYKFASVVIRNMDKNNSDTIGITAKKDILVELLIEHIIDELLFADKLKLLNYLEKQSNKKLDEFLNKVKKYFDSEIFTNKNLSGILFQNKGQQQLIVASTKDKIKEWKLAEGEMI